MSKYTRNIALGLSFLLVLFGVCLINTGSASASYWVQQTAFDGSKIPQFNTPLPIFGPGYNKTLPRVKAFLHPFLTVKMKEVQQQVLPTSMGFGPTNVWVYEISDSFTGEILGPALWPGVTVEAWRDIPTTITYENHLPRFDPGNPLAQVQGLITSDPEIHWSNPLDPTKTPVRFPAADQAMMHNPCMNMPTATITDPYTGITYDCDKPYVGPQPTVPHLHGGELPSYFDGGPDAWFTPDFESIMGPAFSTFNALFNFGNTPLKGTGYTSGILGTSIYRQWLARQSFAKPGPGKATYIYDNAQEPGTLWFHDHGLGVTRTNVYSGLEAFYFIRDPFHEPFDLPKGAYEVEMAIQDRQFDTTGQLFFPDGWDSQSPLVICGTGMPGDPCLNGPPPNPALHTFWNPEFVGDVAIVNGAPWPVMQVEPRRYLFRLLDGSNARMYNMTFGDTASGEIQPGVYIVGNDDNYLDAPVKMDMIFNSHTPPGDGYNMNVFIAPGQRAYVIVDFSRLAGKTVTLLNDAPIPFPAGLSPVPFPYDPVAQNCPNSSVFDINGVQYCPADQPQMSKIMQFKVNLPLRHADSSCNPARGGCRRPAQMVNLASVTNNGTARNVVKKRQLILKEWEGNGNFGSPGGPIEVLVQNTRWDGLFSPGIEKDFPTDGMSELPRQGSIEEWEIINLTADAHPMHTHLTQFQILNRQDFDINGYIGSVDPQTGTVVPGAWVKAFYPPGTTFDSTGAPQNGVQPVCAAYTGPPFNLYLNTDYSAFNPCPEYGPPLDYLTPNADGAIGGNPAISPYLLHRPRPTPAWEKGWRDTAVVYPGQVLRMLVRWTPTSVRQAAGSSMAGKNLYSFDPTAGPGYVWHCHIVDHEDNEMMRPYKVVK